MAHDSNAHSGAPTFEGKWLARGGYGVVFLVQKGAGADSRVALKREPKKANDEESDEIRTLKALRHPNVVRYLGNYSDETHVFLEMEFASLGSVEEWITRRGVMSEVEATFSTRCLLRGLAYLHGKKFVHRDVKPGNLLVFGGCVCKLGDFGLAKSLGGRKFGIGEEGTRNYIAPEILLHKQFYASSDIWSTGCTFYRLFERGTPVVPYQGNLREEATTVGTRLMQEPIPIPPILSATAQSFLKAVLQPHHSNRPTATQALRMTLFQASYIPESLPESCMTTPMGPEELKMLDDRRIYTLNEITSNPKDGTEGLKLVRAALHAAKCQPAGLEVVKMVRRNDKVPKIVFRCANGPAKSTICLNVKGNTMLRIDLDGVLPTNRPTNRQNPQPPPTPARQGAGSDGEEDDDGSSRPKRIRVATSLCDVCGGGDGNNCCDICVQETGEKKLLCSQCIYEDHCKLGHFTVSTAVQNVQLSWKWTRRWTKQKDRAAPKL